MRVDGAAHRMLGTCLVLLALCPASAVAIGAPNIVYILADDLGWKDVGFHGGKAQTPNLDRLAQSGVRLEKFYTLPYSTPTRAALLTGRYPMRYGLQTLSILAWNSYGLPVDERILPQALKDAGYRTAAFGTWQLGHARRDFWPTQRGFDYFYGCLNGNVDHLKKVDRLGKYDWQRNGRSLRDEGYDVTLIAKDAAAYISRHDASKPLFLYVSLPTPSAPLQAPKGALERYGNVAPEERRVYYAMITALDDAVGTIVSALQKKNLWENTVLVFHSDNGGAVRHKYATGDGDVQKNVSDNGPFLGGAGDLHEGGVRVVAFAVAPGRIEPGIVTERIHVTDLYPTLIHVAGGELGQAKPIDGLDVWPVIAKGAPSPRKEMLIDVEEFRGAISVGNWKLIVYGPLPVQYELYNIQDDPSEEDNHAEREPQKLQELLARLNEFAWEMSPSLYLADLARSHKYDTPMFWGENPDRP